MIDMIPKRAPSRVKGKLSRVIGTVHADAYPVYVHQAVLDEILDYSDQNLQRELGGFLVGGIFEDERNYVEIRHFLPAVEALSKVGSLTFTHGTWSEMTRRVREQFPDETVVGWHHTHPGFGIFLSSYDMFIHRNFFSQPWQVALVVDPQNCEFGFFQWVGDDVVDCGFICVPSATKS